MSTNISTTRITVNGKLQHYSVNQIFDKKYTKLEFTTFSFSPKLINKLSEHMDLHGVIGSYTNLSLANNPNFLYAIGKVHTKVMLLSNEQGDLRVITGSANLSSRALDENTSQGENIVIEDNDKQLFNQWHDYFDQLWNLAKTTKQPTLGKYIKPKKALTPSQLQNHIVELDSKIDASKKREQLYKKQIKKLKKLKPIKEINQLKSQNNILKNKLQKQNSQLIANTLTPLVTGSYSEKEQLLDQLIGFNELNNRIKKAKIRYYTIKNSKPIRMDLIDIQITHVSGIRDQLFSLSTQFKNEFYQFIPEYQQKKLKYINTNFIAMDNLINKYHNLKLDITSKQFTSLFDDDLFHKCNQPSNDSNKTQQTKIKDTKQHHIAKLWYAFKSKIKHQ